MSAAGHRVLVVEDHEATLQSLVEIVQSLGDDVRTAVDVEAALAAIAEEEFCYLLLDQELPQTMGKTALVSGGARVMEALRKRDRRRVEGIEGTHVTPIVVVSGYSEGYPFVAKMFRQGADRFVGKPVREHVEELADAIKGVLRECGRGEHAGCAGLRLGGTHAERGVAAVEADGLAGAIGAAPDRNVEMVLDGGIEPGRTTLLVNGVRRSVQDNRFLVLLKVVVAFLKGPGTWSSRAALGLVHRDTMTRLREVFEGCGAEGVDVIEGDRRGNFRLNPGVVVRVEWGALEGHPDPGVQRVVGEWKKRRA